MVNKKKIKAEDVRAVGVSTMKGGVSETIFYAVPLAIDLKKPYHLLFSAETEFCMVRQGKTQLALTMVSRNRRDLRENSTVT